MHSKKSALLKSVEPLRTFALELRAEPSVDSGPALRVALKKLLRDHGLRATRVSYGKPEAAIARWQP